MKFKMNKRKLVKIGLVAALILLVLAVFVPLPVSVHVVDAETGEPIVGAKIMIVWGQFGPLRFARPQKIKTDTDEKGYLRIKQAFYNAASHMTVYKEGYVCWSSRNVFPSWEHRQGFRLKNGMEIALQPMQKEYSIEGHDMFIFHEGCQPDDYSKRRRAFLERSYVKYWQVVDAVTRQPLKDAVVTVFWSRKEGGRMGLLDESGDTELYDTLTNEKGKFCMPDYSFKYYNLKMLVYKKGYVCFSNEYIFPDWRVNKKFKYLMIQTKPIKLYPLTENYDPEKHLMFMKILSKDHKKDGLFERAINYEDDFNHK